MSEPRNLTRKLLGDHLLEGDLVPGEEMDLTVDQILIEDATGSMTALQFEALGADNVAVPLAVMYVDHNVLQIDDKNMDEHRYLQSFSARYGIRYSHPGNGISHYVHLERFARPGELLVGADSHSTMAGAVGMFAVGAGGLDVAVAMAGYSFSLECPKVVGVELCGELPSSVQSKDIILELLRRYGVRGWTLRGARGRGTSLRVHGGGCFYSFGDGSGHDLQHDHGAWSHRRRLPKRRADERVARRPEARGGLRPTRRRPRCLLRRKRSDRAPAARAADCGPVLSRQRGAGARRRRHEDGPGVRRLLGELLLRRPRHRCGRPAGERRAPPHRDDGHAGVAPDPGHHFEERRLPRPRRRWCAHARARLRSLHRRRTGPLRRRTLGEDLQPQLPGPQRDERR